MYYLKIQLDIRKPEIVQGIRFGTYLYIFTKRQTRFRLDRVVDYNRWISLRHMFVLCVTPKLLKVDPQVLINRQNVLS